MLNGHVSRITVAEVKFLQRVAGKTRRDYGRIRERLEVPSLKTIMENGNLNGLDMFVEWMK